MSSGPFCLGVPVVDHLKPKDGTVVLRTKDVVEAWERIKEVQQLLSKKSRISIYFIGYRCDHPVPLPMWFSEISIELKPEHLYPGYYSLYHFTVNGTQEDE